MTREDSNPSTAEKYRPAGFWMRFWAYLFDFLIVLSIKSIILKALSPIHIKSFIWYAFTGPGIVMAIVFYLYFLLMTKFYGQTVGKMIFGLKVIPYKGESLGWEDLIFREVIGRFIYKSFLLLNVLYIVVAFNKDKQGIHDIFADTKVVHVP